MTRPGIASLLVCLFVTISASAPAATKKPVKKVPIAKANPKAVSSGRSASKAVAKARSSRQAAQWRNTRATRRPAAPATPTSERVRLVQEALIERGYLQGSASGYWDASSVEALKKFETAKNVKADGKIDSKVLIELGLGPKYEANLSLPGASSSSAVAADDSRNDASPRLNN